MKKLLSIMIMFGWLSAGAAIWRINSNPQVSANFSGINEANNHYTVNNGDTLYLENGSFFPSSSVTKTLTLIGPGYFLPENDSTYANPFPAQIQSLDINGPGARIIGVKIIGTLTLNANNIVIERSQTGTINAGYVYNLTVRQCYIGGNISSGAAYSSSVYNNIIIGYISLNMGSGSHNIYNNTIYLNSATQQYALTAVNATVINNTVIREPVSPDPGVNRSEYCFNYTGSTNTSFARNVISQSLNPAFPDNLCNKTREDLFVLAGSTDEAWKLKTNSPAIGYGTNGDDCGAYGGPMHYVMSGLPWLLPRIIEAQIPPSGTGGSIPVHIKAKTQEE